jgi:beta-glucosidase
MADRSGRRRMAFSIPIVGKRPPTSKQNLGRRTGGGAPSGGTRMGWVFPRVWALVAFGMALAVGMAAAVTRATPRARCDGRARQLVARMTLGEKIAEAHGAAGPGQNRVVAGIPRLGIPALNITNGPAGIGNGGPGHEGRATAMPAPIALAATFDVSLATRYGAVLGSEAAALRNGLVEGPNVNIARVPQNGRTFEAYGEDPYLTAQIAAAVIRGIQSRGVLANVKHYAGNNQETDRARVNAVIDERTLREIYLPAFEASVTQGGVDSIMCAFNKVNGIFSCEHPQLLHEILRTEWGFSGFVTSDFGAVHSTVASAMAGLDLEMPNGRFFADPLRAAVASGRVPVSVLGTMLIRRYRTMMCRGVFDHPPAGGPIPQHEHGAVARAIAEAGMVLLKNAGGLLPLHAGQLRSIAVLGPFAARAKTGGGGSSSVEPLYTIDPLPAIRDRVGPGIRVEFADGSDLDRAAAAARAASVAVVMVGDNDTEGEDHGLALEGSQDRLVEVVAAANPRTVVVLKTGSAVLMPWLERVPAVLEAWYPGEEDGRAVAAVLFGDSTPSGKLPLTFPAALADLPVNTARQYPGLDGEARYSEGVFVGYRHYDARGIRPLFPFGHGLSYTEFVYRNLVITPNQVSFARGAGGAVSVDLDVTNAGPIAGGEVVQIYVGKPANVPVREPPKWLKGFEKVSLTRGETRHVRVQLGSRAFSFWDVTRHGWAIAPGTYHIFVGSSSRDIRLQGQVDVR